MLPGGFFCGKKREKFKDFIADAVIGDAFASMPADGKNRTPVVLKTDSVRDGKSGSKQK